MPSSCPASSGKSRNERCFKINRLSRPFWKIFLVFRNTNQVYVFRRPVPNEGRCATSSTRGGMRWTRRCCETSDVCGGRRSRVVLTPRRWRQVGDDALHRADDGGKKARSPGRARYKLLKPLRGECRVNRCDRGDYACVFFISHTRLRALSERPAFPAPSDFEKARVSLINSGALRRGNAGVHPD